jgi:hypothetical protein
MKLILAILLAAAPAFGQSSSIAPWITPQFKNGNAPIANGFVCTTASGSATNWTATYQDSALGTPNQNPIRLNTAGEPVNGSSFVQIFLLPTSYRFTIYAAAPLTGTKCNGVNVGALIRQVDPVYDLSELITAGLVTFTSINNRQYCTTGANFGAKFTAAVALLPGTGGIVDCSNLQGAQSITADVFTGVTKPITLIWPTGTAATVVNLSQPSTMTWYFPEGGRLTAGGGITVTIHGSIEGSISQHFSGSGTFSIVSTQVPEVYPQWWGAVGDGVTDDTIPIQAAVDGAGVARIKFNQGTYLTTSTVTISTSRESIWGAGPQSTIWKFNPGSSNLCALKFQLGSAAAIAQNEVRDLAFDATGDTTHVKTALCLVDAEEFTADNIAISNWHDATAGSTGVRVQGRQTLEARRWTFNADQPVRISIDPNTGVVAADHFHFQDIYTIADPSQANFLVDDGVFLTNVTWDGYQAWVQGLYGLYWNDTTGASNSRNVSIQNVRYEQDCATTMGCTPANAGYALYISPNHQLIGGLNIINNYTDGSHNGYYVRNSLAGTFSGNIYEGLQTALNVNSSSSFPVVGNFFNLNAGATVSTTGFNGVWCDNDILGLAISRGYCGFGGVVAPDAPLVTPNSAGLSGRNAANSANVPAIGIDASDQVAIATGGATTAIAGPVTIAGATPVGAGGLLGLGITAGFGTGSAGTTVTTTTKGGGTGPTTPQTVVKYLKISYGGADYWIPLVQ